MIRQYADLFEVEKEWRWSGVHYQRTAQDWLDNFDGRRDEIERVLRKVHGGETALWMRRWRWFLLATSGLFGYAGGSEWGVSHCRLKAAGWRFADSCRASRSHPQTTVPGMVFLLKP